jgi:hypothetical protein
VGVEEAAEEAAEEVAVEEDLAIELI